MNVKSLTFLLVPLLVFLTHDSLEAKNFTAQDMVTLKRVGSPTLSPDGTMLAFTIRSVDLENDKASYDIYTLDLQKNNSQPIAISNDPAADTSPKWSANGRYLYFLSNRTQSNQLWRYDVKEKIISQMTHFPVDIGSYKLSSNDQHIVFSSSVFPDCKTLACSKKRFEDNTKKKASGKLYDKIFVRHWDHWLDETQSKLFSAQLNAQAPVEKARLISGEVNGNVPSSPFGGEEEYTISPDGKTVIFTARISDASEPYSTNFDLYKTSITGGKTENITSNNPAWDTQPVFSPDGKKLAWLAMDRPGFEADRLQVKMMDLASGKVDLLTADWDRSFSSFSFSTEGNQLYLNGNNLGKKTLWSYDIAHKKIKELTHEGYVGSFTIAKDTLVYQYDDLTKPADLYKLELNTGQHSQLTAVNKEALSNIEFGEYEQFSFKGWNDETVYGYIVKPADFDANKKYPLAFLIHGGPQGSFSDHFHYRWNPQTYTGQGFVAVMIDFHGSTGYGQKFTDSITQDWGGKPFEDLQKGMQHLADNYSYIDTNNACALGASYGGYMINWIAGNWSDQFKCLVNHDGIFDNRMMYYSTEELWFVEWENGGTYFDKPENFEKHNPVHFVKNWKTPMLVVQGTKDFRVPETQAIATFTALQRQNIPSKFLVFENENHWVIKPNNSIQWHQVVNDWLHQWLTPQK